VPPPPPLRAPIFPAKAATATLRNPPDLDAAEWAHAQAAAEEACHPYPHLAPAILRP
jgi:hypothetical protein